MKILASFDESETSKATVPALQSIAREANVEVYLVTVLEPHAATNVRDRAIGIDDQPASAGKMLPSDQVFATNIPSRVVETKGQAMEHFQHEAESRLVGIGNELGSAKFECHLVWSEKPAEAIVKLANEVGADMIALATHGRSGLSRTIAGSVADTVIRTAGRPVLVVRPGGMDKR